jgi:plastocyanin
VPVRHVDDQRRLVLVGVRAAARAREGHDGRRAQMSIINFTFTPSNLEVSPGQQVIVKNGDGDGTPHSVTSESAPGQFTPGGVNGVSFDTGIFTGTASFTIPATAPHGTVIPCYCRVHLAGMANTCQIPVK